MANVLTKREVHSRKIKFGIAAGLFDFVATVGSMVLIFVCIVFLTSLVNWVISDAPTTFSSIYDSVYTAVFTDDVLAIEQGAQNAQ